MEYLSDDIKAAVSDAEAVFVCLGTGSYKSYNRCVANYKIYWFRILNPYIILISICQIILVSSGQKLESEENDRHSIDLPGNQLLLLQDAVSGATAASDRIVVLLFNAGPLDVSWAVDSDRVRAIMACFFPGQATGDALVRILTMTGPNSNPAARLPATWHAHMDQVKTIFIFMIVSKKPN